MAQLNPWAPKATQIRRIMAQPCDVDAWIWVTGFFAASPVFLFSVFSPDCVDYTADRFRLAARRRRKVIMSPSDLIRPTTPQDINTGQVPFKILSAAQKVGFYFLLVDATLDWIITGTSFAYQWQGCVDPTAGYGTCTMVHKVPEAYAAGSGYITSWNRHNDYIFRAGPNGVAVPKGYAASAGFSHAQILNQFPGLPDADVRLRVRDNIGGNILVDWMDPGYDKDGRRGVNWSAPSTLDLDSSHTVCVEFEKGPGAWMCDADLTVSGDQIGGFAKSACGVSQGGF